jgi:hypothetical protein
VIKGGTVSYLAPAVYLKGSSLEGAENEIAAESFYLVIINRITGQLNLDLEK